MKPSTLLLFTASLFACASSVDPTPGSAPQKPVATTAPTAPTAPTTPTSVPTTDPPAKLEEIHFPQARSKGGAVIKAPKVIPIVFQGDTHASQIADFHEKIATSEYWSTIAGEYGVGAITPLPLVSLTEQAPVHTTNPEIETWLVDKFTNDTTLGAPDPNTLYAIYYPKSTTIELDGPDDVNCRTWSAYHYEVQVGAVRVGFAVMPFCAISATNTDELTVAASHELFEWATDPFVDSDPAYQAMDAQSGAWDVAFGAELADLCYWVDQGATIKPADIGHAVQRIWSNKAAAGGHYPCAPSPTRRYFVGVPLVKDDVSIFGTKVKGVRVGVGQSVNVPIQLHSDDPTGEPWTLQVMSLDTFIGQFRDDGKIRYEIARSTGKHQDLTSVKITALKEATRVFVVVATRGTELNVWPAVVTTN